jgi:hypothetical protein
MSMRTTFCSVVNGIFEFSIRLRLVSFRPDNSFAAFVERGGNYHDLMVLVEGVIVEVLPKALTEVRGQASAGCEATINLRNVFRFKFLDPTRVIQ